MDKEEYLLDIKIRDLEERNTRLTQNPGSVDQLELEDIHNVQEDEEEEDSDTDIDSEASDSEESLELAFGV